MWLYVIQCLDRLDEYAQHYSKAMQDFYSFLFSEELVMITEMLVFNKPYCQKCWFLLKHIAPDV